MIARHFRHHRHPTPNVTRRMAHRSEI